MNTSAALLGEGAVYATGGGERFHEGADCPALLSGQRVHLCHCGDRYCGCAGETPMRPGAMSVGSAVVTRGLKPCAVCYPGFAALDVMLPAGDNFGHRLEVVLGRLFCARCEVFWPCGTAVLLGLAAAPEAEEGTS